MRKKIIRKKLLKILAFIFATLAFPAVITLLLNGKLPQRIYSAEGSGKYVIINSGGLTETIDVEAFIPCAVMGQLSIENDEELLKSFAVIMRTYILLTMENENTIPCEKLKLPYLTYDEMEVLWGESFPDNYNRLMKIVSDTSHRIITHNGKLISPYYHSVSGGKTRTAPPSMGDGFSYLMSASCPEDTASPNYFKAYYYTYEEFASKLRSIDKNISVDDSSPLENVQIVSRDDAGYVLTMSVGGISIDGTRFYEAMEIQSPSFMIEEYNGGVRIAAYGSGHGLGVSLGYAAYLAAGGSSYIEILHYFYTDVEIQD